MGTSGAKTPTGVFCVSDQKCPFPLTGGKAETASAQIPEKGVKKGSRSDSESMPYL